MINKTKHTHNNFQMANILWGKQMLQAKIIIFRNASTSSHFFFPFFSHMLMLFFYCGFSMNCLLKIHHTAPIQTFIYFCAWSYTLLPSLELWRLMRYNENGKTHIHIHINTKYTIRNSGVLCSHIKKLITFNWWNYSLYSRALASCWLLFGGLLCSVHFHHSFIISWCVPVCACVRESVRASERSIRSQFNIQRLDDGGFVAVSFHARFSYTRTSISCDLSIYISLFTYLPWPLPISATSLAALDIIYGLCECFSSTI